MNAGSSNIAELGSTIFTMLSCCCPSVVYLDRRGEQRFYEASKPVSSHGLLLERTQKVPTGNVGSQPFSISIDAAALFSINNVTVLGLTFGFRNYTIGLRVLSRLWLPAGTWLDFCSCYVLLLPLSAYCPTSHHGQKG